jgi:hypothetical protein
VDALQLCDGAERDNDEGALGPVFGAAPWIGWVINLMLVQWWLNRTANKPISQLI